MRKDIFIDNNIASKFSNPQDIEYVNLTNWLIEFDSNDIENKHNYAHLVVSQKLLVEYYRSNSNAIGGTSIPTIIDTLTRDGRLIKISNDAIKQFQLKYFTKTIQKKLRSNNEDRDHIPIVFLSDRKFALSFDDNFIFDLKNFKGYTVKIEKKPQDLNYK